MSLLELEDDDAGLNAQSASSIAATAAGVIGAVASGLGASSLVGFGGLGNLPKVQAGSSGGSALEETRGVAVNCMEHVRRSQLPYGYDPQPLLVVSDCMQYFWLVSTLFSVITQRGHV